MLRPYPPPAGGSPSTRGPYRNARHPSLSVGEAYLGRVLEQAKIQNLSNADILRTLTALTARSIALAYNTFLPRAPKLATVICSGGGTANPILLEEMQAAFGSIPVQTSDAYGVPSAAKEAAAFALLAWQTLQHRPANEPAATGAQGPRILGSIMYP